MTSFRVVTIEQRIVASSVVSVLPSPARLLTLLNVVEEGEEVVEVEEVVGVPLATLT